MTCIETIRLIANPNVKIVQFIPSKRFPYCNKNPMTPMKAICHLATISGFHDEFYYKHHGNGLIELLFEHESNIIKPADKS